MGFLSRLRPPAIAALSLLAAACNNNPWPEADSSGNTLFSAAVQNSPRHLDPTASYYNDESAFTYQIYEPLYGYHYLKRPFELVPKAAAAVVEPRYIGKDGRTLPPDAPAEQVVESVYDVPIKRGIRFQPHPAFAIDEQGRHRYHAMKPGVLGERRTPLQFEHQGTRELVQLMLSAFSQRRAAQKAIVEWALSRRDMRAFDSRNTFLGQMLVSVSVRSQGLKLDRLLTATEMFVLTRAFLGALRTAIWNDEADTGSPQFALALTDLVDGYVHQLVRREATPAAAR